MNNIVRNDVDLGEALVGGNLQEPILPHADFAIGISKPASECGNLILEPNLGVSIVGFKEKQLSIWF